MRPLARRFTNKRAQRGFTLLELMISLGLLAVIAGFLFSSLGTVNRAWRSMEVAGERAGEQAVRDYLQTRLSQAVFVLRRTAGAGDVVAFRGTADKVSFVAETDGSLNAAGLYEVTISLEEAVGFGTGPRDMIVEEKLYRPLEKSRVKDAVVHRRTLSANISGLRFRYFGRQRHNDPQAKWYDSWSSRRYLPNLVAVRVRTTGPQNVEEEWAEIRSALRLSNTRLSGS